MISEIPVTEPLEESAEPLEPEPLEPPPPPSPPKKEASDARVPQAQPEKRRPGRPRKEPKEQPKENVPPPEAKPKPKTRAKVKDEPFKATLQEAQTAPSFSIGDLSNGQLMAELVNRRRATEREMKTNLYRSFVM